MKTLQFSVTNYDQALLHLSMFFREPFKLLYYKMLLDSNPGLSLGEHKGARPTHNSLAKLNEGNLSELDELSGKAVGSILAPSEI